MRANYADMDYPATAMSITPNHINPNRIIFCGYVKQAYNFYNLNADSFMRVLGECVLIRLVLKDKTPLCFSVRIQSSIVLVTY